MRLNFFIETNKFSLRLLRIFYFYTFFHPSFFWKLKSHFKIRYFCIHIFSISCMRSTMKQLLLLWHDNGFNTFHFICILLYYMHTAIVYVFVLFAENEMKIVKGFSLCMLGSFAEFNLMKNFSAFILR